MAILLDETNTVATKKILPGVADNFFLAGPLMAYLKARYQRGWTGPLIQDNYLFKPMKGGAYAKGGTFDITKRQTFSGIQFSPRYYETNITEYLEDLEVESAGPTAVFSRLKTDMANAALTMSAILEIAGYRHGQALATDNRSLEINGLEELLTNGTDRTWSAATAIFPTYGNQTRADVAPALNSPTGLIAASVPQVSFRFLEHSYLSCCIGKETPKLGITTNRGMGYIAETFTPQQKIDTTDPEINWPGFKFNNATIVMGQYVPGADGKNDPDLGNYLTPDGNETFWWLNPGPAGDASFIKLWIASSPKFAFGFTGFKGARDDNQVSGQILFAGNLTGNGPRYSRAHFGIAK